MIAVCCLLCATRCCSLLSVGWCVLFAVCCVVFVVRCVLFVVCVCCLPVEDCSS